MIRRSATAVSAATRIGKAGAAGLIVLAAYLGGCFDDRVASSEVGNPPAKGKVVGALLEEDGSSAGAGRPAAGARVRLYPVGFDPVRDAGDTSLARYLDTADSAGTFAIEDVDTGDYNVLAVDPGSGDMALLRGVRVAASRTVTARGGILRAPGTVTVSLPDVPARAEAYVYIPGTGVYAQLDSLKGETPTLHLDGVPAGAMPALLYRGGPASAETREVAPGVVVFPGDTVPAGLLPGWAYGRRLFLDTSPGGVDVAADAAHFPVAIRLGRGGLPFDFSQAAADGRDLRFTDPKGGHHNHEIETWDSAGGQAVVWVCPGTLKGGSASQFVRMFWGNPEAQSAATRAFTEALGYAGVWHMHRIAAGGMPDASYGSNPIVAENVGPAQLVPSPLGLAVRLDGTPRQLRTAKAVPNPHAFSLSLWFRTTTDSGGKLIGFGAVPDMADSSRDRHLWMDDTGRVHFGVLPTSGPVTGKRVLSAPGRWNDGKWHHVGAVLGDPGTVLYLDGRKVAEDTTVRSAQAWSNNTGWWRMGFDFPFYDWPYPPSARYFQGELDEVQVSHKAFPAHWFRLIYESQREGARLVRGE